MPRNRKEKFKKLAERRVSRLLKDMKLISNLSNKSNYEYEEKDAKKIISAIEAELKYLKMQFNQNSKKNKSFKL